ncbi:MAG TPA: hypothetical protein VKP30_27830, partial [Polyangiaceae bacterium]|nr:hypothetical protein [Polyangiaceae bacterium]
SPEEIISDIRPSAAHASIKNDFPNEDGIPNHDALQTGNIQNQDNHDFLTGTGEDGKLYQGSTNTNCKDWTSQDKTIRPRVGHSWPRAGMGDMTNTGTTGTTTGGGFILPGSGATMATMNSWVSSLDENGCAPGINLSESSIPMGSDQGGDGTVGGGGGYGGIYCFAEEP